MATKLERGVVVDGRYDLIEPIGSGGMGEVWLANQRGLDRAVAVKFMHVARLEVPPEKLPEYIDRFKREAASLGKLSHPNIIHAHDYGVFDGTPFLVMEYFEHGFPLFVWKEQAKPSTNEWLRVARTLLSALDHAHAKGVLHRDIKSSNVLARGPAGAPEIKLIDWGVSFILGRAKLTAVGNLVGTLGQTIDPMLFVDPKFQPVPQTDFYALGGLLYSLLCGSRPLAIEDGDENLTKQYAAAQDNKVIPPHEANAAIAGDLEIFLQKMLATKPSDRPPSAAAALAMVDALIAESPVDFAALYEKFPGAPFKKDPPTKNERPSREPRAAADNKKPVVDVEANDGVDLGADKTPDEESAPRERTYDSAVASYADKAPRKIWTIVACVAAVLLLFGAAAYAALSNVRHRRELQNADLQMPSDVTPSSLEKKKPSEAGLDKILAERGPQGQPVATDARLDAFNENVRARYGAGPASAPTGAIDDPSHSDAHTHRPSPPAINPGPQLGITPEKSGASADKATIPNHYVVRAILNDALDTASHDPVRARLEEPITVDGKIIVPVGTVLWGKATYANNRAQASFNRLVFRDKTELQIRAVAVTADGLDGIDGDGELELVENKSDSAPSMAGEYFVAGVHDVAAAIVPSVNSSVPQVAQRHIEKQTNKLTEDDTPKVTKRLTMRPGTRLAVQFNAK
jgi:serine/threonine protein kinase